MGNGVLYTFMATEILFVIGGVLLIVLSITTKAASNAKQNIDTIANTLLLPQRLLTAATVNGVLVLVTFLLSIPSVAAPTNRSFLKVHGYAVILCAVFTLILGVQVWYATLKTGANLANVFANQTSETQSLLQQRFDCCGYRNATSPPFVRDSTCTNVLVAAYLQGCVGPFSSHANSLLSAVFTAGFAIVGIDIILLLGIASLLKDRKDRERYALIDAKAGFSPI